MDDREALVIDTGFNRDSCYKTIKGASDELKVKDLRVFCTHLHADHMGFAAKLASEVLMGKTEVKIVQDMMTTEGYWEEMVNFYIRNGFPAEEARKMLFLHPGRSFYIKEDVEFVAARKDVRVGGIRLKAIETPGHSPGHTCLYDEARSCSSPVITS